MTDHYDGLSDDELVKLRTEIIEHLERVRRAGGPLERIEDLESRQDRVIESLQARGLIPH